MKTTVFFLICSLILTTMNGFAQKEVKGNGNLLTKEILVSNYKRLSLSGNIRGKKNTGQNIKGILVYNQELPIFNYMQKTGNSFLQITTDENLFPLLDIQVIDSCLYIQTDNSLQLLPTEFIVNSSSAELEQVEIRKNVNFYLRSRLSSENLRIRVSGAADAYLNQPIQIQNTCAIKVSGAGNLRINDLNCQNIQVNISGAGDLKLKGSAQTGEYKASGSGDISAYDFVVADLKCRVSGSGDIKAYATNSIDANASGSGDIKYRGNPQVIKRVVSQAANIKHRQ